MSADLNTAGADPYSEVVRQHFFEPEYVGGLPDVRGQVIRGQAGDIAHGAWLQLAACVEGGNVIALRFHVFGCPHLVAALDITCARCEGESVARLREINAAELLQTLQAPLEKTGRLLLIEDVIKSLLNTLDQ